MTIQFDVKSAEPTADELVGGGRVRLKGLLITSAANGVVELKDGNSSGNALFGFNAVAAGNVYVAIPGDGVVFPNGIYVNVLTNAGITVFYG